MSSARLKRKINGLVSRGLLDPDWRTKRVRVAPRRRAQPGLFPGLWAGLWLEISALIMGLRSKPEFPSQQVRKNDRKYWPTRTNRRVREVQTRHQHR